MSGGVLQSDILFLGLTRIPLLFGVSYTLALLNGMVCLLVFITTENFFAFFALPLLHFIAYLICLKEPLIIDLYLMKTSKFMKCKNRMLHGFTNSYDPY